MHAREKTEQHQHVNHERDVGKKPRQTIHDEHEDQNESEAGNRCPQRRGEIGRSKRRPDGVVLNDGSRNGKRTGIEIVCDANRVVFGEVTGDLSLIRDHALNRRRRNVLLVEEHAEQLAEIRLRHLAELLRILRLEIDLPAATTLTRRGCCALEVGACVHDRAGILIRAIRISGVLLVRLRTLLDRRRNDFEIEFRNFLEQPDCRVGIFDAGKLDEDTIGTNRRDLWLRDADLVDTFAIDLLGLALDFRRDLRDLRRRVQLHENPDAALQVQSELDVFLDREHEVQAECHDTGDERSRHPGFKFEPHR